MRLRLICTLTFAVALMSQVTAAPTKSRSVTINSGQITGTLTGFQFVIRETHNDFKTLPNGGFMANSNAHDLRFWSDSGFTSTIAHEIESYNATTGALVAWVRCASCAVGTVIYATWGDSAISTSQQDPATLWGSSNHRLVYHLNDDPNGSAPEVSDSNNVLDLTKTAPPSFGAGSGTVASVTGIIGTAFDFSPQDQYMGYMYQSSSASGVGSNNLTLSCWFYVDNFISQDTSQSFIVGMQGGTYPNKRFTIILKTNGKLFGRVMGDRDNTADTTATITTGGWHHVAMTYDYTAVKIYVDGVLDVNEAATFTAANDVSFYLNSRDTAQSDIKLDEVRLSVAARSADWIAAEFKNQKSSSTFYTMSATTTLTTAVPMRHDGIKIGNGGTLTAADAGHTAPASVNNTLPSTCTVGDIHFDSNATAGQNLYGCTSTNTWSLQAGAGAVSGDVGISVTGTAPQLIGIDTAVVPTFLTATATLNYGTIAAHDCEELTISVPTAAVGDAVSIGIPTGTPATFFAVGHVSDVGVVTVRGCNNDDGSISVSSGAFRATVVRSF